MEVEITTLGRSSSV